MNKELKATTMQRRLTADRLIQNLNPQTVVVVSQEPVVKKVYRRRRALESNLTPVTVTG